MTSKIAQSRAKAPNNYLALLAELNEIALVEENKPAVLDKDG